MAMKIKERPKYKYYMSRKLFDKTKEEALKSGFMNEYEDPESGEKYYTINGPVEMEVVILEHYENIAEYKELIK